MTTRHILQCLCDESESGQFCFAFGQRPPMWPEWEKWQKIDDDIKDLLVLLLDYSWNVVHCCTIFEIWVVKYSTGWWGHIMGLQIVNGATGAKVDQIGCCFFQKLLWPNVLGDLKKISPKISTQISTQMFFLGGVWSLCGNWGSMRKLGLYRGMGKFYNGTPLIDDLRLMIYIAAVCIVTSHRYCSPQRLKCWADQHRS